MYVIIGSKGQLGTALQNRYPDARAVDSDELNITDAAAVEAFDWTGVDAILNAAAYTNVDGAETLEGRAAAWRVNAVGPANLTRIANKHGITLVHVSTDYVFDGSQNPHAETEALTPLGVYGQTKAAGDIAVSLADKHYILRTSWVIGEGNNFVRTMLGLAARDISPSVVGDQIGRLTFTSELVRAVAHLLEARPEYGTYNVSNGGDVTSWADVTRAVYALAARDDLTVTDTSTVEYFANKPEASPRPLNGVLALDKLTATGFTPKDWRDDLKAYIEAERSR